MKRDGNKALLLSACGLDAKRYNEKYEDVAWETCTLRKWLNGKFYNAAFSEEEKERILLTQIKNSDNPRYQTPGGNDTEDRVFLLSIDEAKAYLAEDLERRTAPTPYAVKQGVRTSYIRYNGNCCWWLRSPGHLANNAACVYLGGNITEVGDSVNCVGFAVCPALWVNLELEIE